jgi:hypothetical protein
LVSSTRGVRFAKSVTSETSVAEASISATITASGLGRSIPTNAAIGALTNEILCAGSSTRSSAARSAPRW